MMGKMIFANFVNKLMTDVPGEAHVRALTAPAARKIWYAQPDDVIVLPGPPDEIFLEYAAGLIGIQRNDVRFVVPGGAQDEYLADRIARDPASLSVLKECAGAYPGMRAEVFAQDEPTIELFRTLQMPIEDYASVPGAAVAAVVSRLNTKSGFKDFAAGVGIRRVEGRLAFGAAEVIKVVRDIFSETGSVVVKIDRGSNGFGHWVVREASRISEGAAHLLQFYEQPDRYVVEPQLNFVATPSIEYFVGQDGPRYTRTIDMRCINNAWRGQTSPQVLSPELRAHLEGWGSTAADYLYRKGYRGPFDIDCGLTEDGVLYATEMNCRHTGSTNIAHLLKRLTGRDCDDLFWLSDNPLVDSPLTFADALRRIQERGIAWSESTQVGVIFTANTVAFDKKWRYLVVGQDFEDMLARERALIDILEGG
ncbi:peptide ligase PGM1-related protein [Burkholderia gladioli]|uniref:preATP grasp domain-containing protein n=1 Tax=Burkholderia gladioli TaxID=28095 RepID=UPI002FE14684